MMSHIGAGRTYANGWVVRPYMHDPKLVERLRHGNFIEAAKHDDRHLFLINGNRWPSMRALNGYCEFSNMLSSRYHLLREGDIGNGLDDYFAVTETLDQEYASLSAERRCMLDTELSRLAQPLAEAVEEMQMIDLGSFVAIRKLDLPGFTGNVAETLLRHLDKDWWRTLS